MSYGLMKILRSWRAQPAEVENISITRTETETDTAANAASGLIGRTRRNDYAYENDIG